MSEPAVAAEPLDPQSGGAYIILADTYFKQDCYEDAISNCTMAIQLDSPNSTDPVARSRLAKAHFLRGEALLRTYKTAEDIVKIIADFDDASAFDPCYEYLNDGAGSRTRNLNRYWCWVQSIDTRCQELAIAATKAGCQPEYDFCYVEEVCGGDAEQELAWQQRAQAELVWEFQKVAVVLPEFWETAPIFCKRGWKLVGIGESGIPVADLLNLLNLLKSNNEEIDKMILEAVDGEKPLNDLEEKKPTEGDEHTLNDEDLDDKDSELFSDDQRMAVVEELGYFHSDPSDVDDNLIDEAVKIEV